MGFLLGGAEACSCRIWNACPPTPPLRSQRRVRRYTASALTTPRRGGDDPAPRAESDPRIVPAGEEFVHPLTFKT
jgi:hypothetical protein